MRRAMRPMRAAPAVCELDGPIMTGPRMSKMLRVGAEALMPRALRLRRALRASLDVPHQAGQEERQVRPVRRQKDDGDVPENQEDHCRPQDLGEFALPDAHAE